MARAFETWTVLKHDELVKYNDRLWFVQGVMPDGKTRRVMTVARRNDGKLVIHNAIALEEPLMKELEAFGEPALLVVPNSFHRQDAKIWKMRYPQIKVYCPAGARKGVAKVVPVDGGYAEMPQDDAVTLVDIDGTKQREGVMVVRAGDDTSVVVNDAIMNMPKLGGPIGFFLAPMGRPAVPRVSRWFMVSNRKAFGEHLRRLAELSNLRRVIVSHGKPLTEAPGDVLRALADEFG